MASRGEDLPLQATGCAGCLRRRPLTLEIAPELIEEHEQELAEEAIAAAKPPCREHDERSIHAARRASLAVGCPSALETRSSRHHQRHVSHHLGLDARGKFPRARVVGGQSMWLSTEIEAWLAALPVRRLKGDAPEAPASEKPAGVALSGSCLRGRAS